MHNSDDNIRPAMIETLKEIAGLVKEEWAFDDTSASQSRQFRLAAWHIEQAVSLIVTTTSEQDAFYERVKSQQHPGPSNSGNDASTVGERGNHSVSD